MLATDENDPAVGSVGPIRETASAPRSLYSGTLGDGVVDPKRLARDGIDRGRLAEVRAGVQRVPHLQGRR